MKFQDYLMRHKIVKIGKHILGYVCSEVIVDNPEEFIMIVQQNGYFISEIRWWEYTSITEVPSIGYGGPRDPRCPDKYYFAETDVCISFCKPVRYQDYVSYLVQVKNAYPNLILHPAFDVKEEL